jgi:diamine N-acetyltransferase
LLEDIFIRPDYRKHGVGRKLFTEVVRFGVTNGCKRMDFHVLDWNPAQTFYKGLGASNLTEAEGWQFFRMDSVKMGELLNSDKSD